MARFLCLLNSLLHGQAQLTRATGLEIKGSQIPAHPPPPSEEVPKSVDFVTVGPPEASGLGSLH